MPQSYAALYHHCIFSTKDRQLIIQPEIQPRLFEYIGGLCRARQCSLLSAGGMPDHVHLLVSLSREISVAAFMRDIKSNSSRWINDLDPDLRFEWQAGYGAFTASHSNLDAIQKYIADQAEHHRKKTFKDRKSVV